MGVLTEVFLPVSLAFIMFSMGLALTVDDFKRVVVQPKAFAVGALAQVILLPIVSYVVVRLWSVDSAVAVGVMILAVCPGGVTSNLLTHLAKGDTALSVTLTAVVSSVVTVPFLDFSLSQFEAEYVVLPITRTILSVFLITTVPVAIGMGATDRLEPSRIFAAVLFVVHYWVLSPRSRSKVILLRLVRSA